MADKENQLAEIKKKLKTWEYYFTKCHQRKPSKADIDASPADIKESYTLYAKLKNRKSSDGKCPDSVGNAVWGESVSVKALANSQPQMELTADGELRTVKQIDSQCAVRQQSWTQQFTKSLIGRSDTRLVSSRIDKSSSSTRATNTLPVSETNDSCAPAPSVVSRTFPKKARRVVPRGWREHVQGLEEGDVSRKEGFNGQSSVNSGHPATRDVENGDICYNQSVKKKSNSNNSLSVASVDFPSGSPNVPSTCAIELTKLPGSPTAASDRRVNISSMRSSALSESNTDSRLNTVTESNTESKSSALTKSNKNVRSAAGADTVIGSSVVTKSGKASNSSKVTRSSISTRLPASDALSRPAVTGQPLLNQKDSLPEEPPHLPTLEQPSASNISHLVATDPYAFDDGLTTESQPGQIKPKPRARVARAGRKKGGQRTTPSSSMKRKAADDESGDIGVSVGQPLKKSKVTSSASVKAKSKNCVDGNFVKLNLRKKVYARGKTGLKGAAYKRQQWKNKMAAKRGTACYRCGEEGHWANKCTRGKQTDKQEEFNEATDDFLVDKPADEYLDDIMFDAYSGSERTTPAETKTAHSCQPLFSDVVTESECQRQIQQTLKKVFGFDTFRAGQLETVERVLRGRSTLVMLSTGAGKSLCYQLAAYMYWERSPAVAIVISPLISLMEDQVVDLPRSVTGICLHTGQTESARAKLMDSVLGGNVQFLLCSPEFLCSTSSANIEFFTKIPSISFVCIDEAHCLSEWSHNFRPSYLRVCKVLRKRFGVKCFLGLTATATLPTVDDIGGHLGLKSSSADCIKGNILPPNLNLSISKDLFKEQALLELLQSKRFSCCHSIIIYCTRREQTDRLASVIRTTLGDKEKTTPNVPMAESYHAGLTAAHRRRVQKLFMNGKLRIVVATVAFGMGLDKSDVRAVIHYNLPKGFESYVQEVGRAGRDGLPAECHVFLEPEGTDVSELEKHTYADSVDQSSVRKLLSMIYVPCKCQMLADSVAKQEMVEVDSSVCPGHERAVVVESAISLLNISQQGIATLMFYLELHNPQWLENMSSVYNSCTVKCYGGLAEMHQAAKKCIPLGVAMALARKKSGQQQTRELTFDVMEVANLLNKPSGYIKKELRGLKWMQTAEGQYKRTGLVVEFGDLAMRARVPGNLTESKLDEILVYLRERVALQEHKELVRLNYFYNVLQKLAYKDYFMVAEEVDVRRSESLKKSVIDYFTSADPTAGYQLPNKTMEPDALSYITSQVVRFVQTYSSEHDFSGRDVAKILCGIASPNFPPNIWGRVRGFWRSLLGHDFNTIVKIASEQLLKLR